MDIEISYDQLNENQKIVYDIIGEENFIKLMNEFPSTYIYFPKPEMKAKPSRNRKIVEEFDGGNYFKLGKKYGLCENMIRKIVAEERKRLKSKQMDGQEKFF